MTPPTPQGETPLTDEAARRNLDPSSPVVSQLVPADFARDLERRCAALREQIESDGKKVAAFCIEQVDKTQAAERLAAQAQAERENAATREQLWRQRAEAQEAEANAHRAERDALAAGLKVIGHIGGEGKIIIAENWSPLVGTQLYAAMEKPDA